ncbi:MAG: DUF1385 domain-containing protein [Candidatus Margulisbacteria bacterium]|nr:DUF1385 domain-containing protein [Candidatus Margulisiibacteriota bacterium]MBU1022218.1 DUF1385 domain-containing protein [Candidatus Margulisiibacteriota bacterium]MBU1729343.1 DUF1385 domain-containing protein [Candidatus Margulisiibacteriota bacterium]MBU1955616.1 DUF1385 domain-containing protein [Candidatus Margulisiibacteriota bacterium]
MPENQIAIGGQAVIEGVLMRSQTAWAIAVRNPQKEIVLKKKDEIPWTKKYKILGLPIIRGVVTLIETFRLGVMAINYSANINLEDQNEQITKNEFIVSMVVSFGVAILLFIVTPAFIFTQLKGFGINIILLNLIEGLIRICIFLSFLFAVSLMPDMKRVFEYHGAEHMAVHLWDETNDKSQLTVENAKRHKTLHPSCGTSFVLIVLIVSIVVFAFLGRPSLLTRIALKVALLPLIAGVSYEIIRIARRKNAPFIFKMLVAPGMLLQYITTKPPRDDQIEVALESLKAVL